MRLGRTIFVFLVVLSVALLPVPGMIAHAASSDLSLRAPDCCADCCNAGTPCGSLGGCTLNCFGTFGAVVPAARFIVAPPPADAKTWVVGDPIVHPLTITPPLPPPRV